MKSTILMHALLAMTLTMPSAALAESTKKKDIDVPKPTFPREEDRVLDFKKLDKDADGIVSRDEISDPTLFTKIDTNKDGGITAPELDTWLDTNKHKTIDDILPPGLNLPPPQDQRDAVPDNTQIIDSNPNPEEPVSDESPAPPEKVQPQ